MCNCWPLLKYANILSWSSSVAWFGIYALFSWAFSPFLYLFHDCMLVARTIWVWCITTHRSCYVCKKLLCYYITQRYGWCCYSLYLFYIFTFCQTTNTKSYYASIVLLPWLAFLKPYLMLDVTDLAKKKSGAGGIWVERSLPSCPFR